MVLVEFGRGPSGGFLDDVDRQYVVARLEDAFSDPVTLQVLAQCAPAGDIVLPGRTAPAAEMALEHSQARQLARELDELLPRLQVHVVETPKGAGETRSDGVEKYPMLRVCGPSGTAVRFVGVPRGNLFRAFVELLRRAATLDPAIDAEVAAALERLPATVGVSLFVTPTCPGCPPAIQTAIGMGLASTRVQVDVVNALECMDLVRRWDVSGVPTAIVNSAFAIEAAVSTEVLLEFLRHAADPSHPRPHATVVPFRACGRLDTQ